MKNKISAAILISAAVLTSSGCCTATPSKGGMYFPDRQEILCRLKKYPVKPLFPAAADRRAWNGLPEEGYLPPLEALTVFHKVLVENGSLFLALPSSEYSKENVATMANEAGFGIDAIFPQPETGLFSFIQNMSTKKHPESASVIVYHLKKLDTLNFHVF